MPCCSETTQNFVITAEGHSSMQCKSVNIFTEQLTLGMSCAQFVADLNNSLNRFMYHLKKSLETHNKQCSSYFVSFVQLS